MLARLVMLFQRSAVVLFILRGAVAFDNDGHAAIGMTAMSGISGNSLTQLKRLLNGRDVVDISGWGHRVCEKYPQMERLFTQLTPREESDLSCGDFFNANECPEGQCLTQALKFFYLSLINKPELIPPQFKLPVKLKLTDADKMKLLVHLIGDIHQPMRLGFTFNNGGRTTHIKLADRKPETVTTVFDYWESNLTQKLITDRANFWFSGWTHINSLGKASFTRERDVWESASVEERLKLFESWANETAQVMCTKCQRPILAEGAAMGSSPDMKKWIPEGYVIPSRYFFQDYEVLKSRILTAGMRVCVVLNSILASRDAKSFRQGSGVIAVPDHEYRVGNMADGMKSLTKRTNDTIQSLGINLVIVCVVLVVFILGMRRLVGQSPIHSTTSASARNSKEAVKAS